MPNAAHPVVYRLAPMRVASYATFTESPAAAFAILQRWGESQPMPPGWRSRYFGFPCPDPFGPGFEAWMTIPDTLPVDTGPVSARVFPECLNYAVFPAGWDGDTVAWVAAHTPGCGLHQGFHEYVFPAGTTDPRHAQARVYAPIADDPLPTGLDVVELPSMEVAVVPHTGVPGFLEWFHAFVGQHAPEERRLLRLFQAPGQTYEAWIVQATSAHIPEDAKPRTVPGGRYARLHTADMMLPAHIEKGWQMAEAHGLLYDGARGFLIEPTRHRNDIARKNLAYLYYPVT